MKATGIVRCIDALGRVVIPKEIRRTMKIRENEPLEIFINEDQVIFRKYSAVFQLRDISQRLADILFEQRKMPVIVCDMDKVVSVAGITKNEVINKRISQLFIEYIETCKPFAYQIELEKHLYPIEGDKRYVVASTPILNNGRPTGAIMFLSQDGNSTQTATEADISLIQAFASCISKQLLI